MMRGVNIDERWRRVQMGIAVAGLRALGDFMRARGEASRS
jgi:hypothetical protein